MTTTSGPFLEELPVETRTKLRSTQILTSLPQLVSELLQNALDAGARNIDIGINCEDWICWVRDDGQGISKDGLYVLAQGSENGRYNTSKSYTTSFPGTSSTFGFRGEALASAADLGCLEICSRTLKAKQTWSIIIKGGTMLYNGTAVRWRRESPGTTVCVRDAFYNLPIRRISHPSPSKTIELVRGEIEQYALVFPNISFSLERSKHEMENCEKLLTIPKTRSTLATFKHIFGRALVEHIFEIDASSESRRLEGFVSLNGAQSKAHQFLYVNNHPMTYCDLHRAIDSRFANSSFGKHAFDDEGETSMRPDVRRSPRKSEKKPVYVLNLRIPTEQIDNCIEPSKASVEFQNRTAILSFLSAEIQTFLIRNGFATHRRVDSCGIPTPPRKKRKPNPYIQPPQQSIDTVREATPQASAAPLYISSDTMTNGEISWTDPTTGESFIVDGRTGNSVSQARQTLGSQSEEPPHRRRTLPMATTLKQAVEVAEEVSTMPSWVRKALSANDAYSLPEKRIPAFPVALKPPDVTDEVARTRGHNWHDSHAPFPSISGPGTASLRFHKGSLLHARVISQVDRKFVACCIPTTKEGSEQAFTGSRPSDDQTPQETIVLIDQHAADERVRVERFLKDLCMGYLCPIGGGGSDTGVKTRLLSPASLVLLTHHEVRQLSSSEPIQAEFRRWGFEFASLSGAYLPQAGTDTASTESGYVQVEVQSVPDMVADKLLQGYELRDLIKAFIARLADEMGGDSECLMQEDSQNDLPWLKALRRCPRELIDLVNSKACRGAIMFNDSLTIDQCEKLIQQLSHTVFPFQCAHGRPSLAPLTNVGKQTRSREARQGITWQWNRFEKMQVTS